MITQLIFKTGKLIELEDEELLELAEYLSPWSRVPIVYPKPPAWWQLPNTTCRAISL